MPEPAYNPAELTRLSQRKYAEEQAQKFDPRYRQSMTQGGPRKPPSAAELSGGMMQNANPLARIGQKALRGGAEGVGGVLRAVGDVVGSDTLAGTGEYMAKNAQEYQRAMGPAITGDIQGFGPKSVVPDVLKYTAEMGESAASSLAQSIAASSLGPAAVIPMLSVMSAGSQYNKARDAGQSTLDSLTNAVPYGIFEAVGEKFAGLDKATAALKALANKGSSIEAKKQAGDSLLKMGVREIPGELITYLGQTGVDLLPGIGLNPNLTMSEFLDGLRDTVVQAGMMGGATAGVGKYLQGRTPQKAAPIAEQEQPAPPTDKREALKNALAEKIKAKTQVEEPEFDARKNALADKIRALAEPLPEEVSAPTQEEAKNVAEPIGEAGRESVAIPAQPADNVPAAAGLAETERNGMVPAEPNVGEPAERKATEPVAVEQEPEAKQAVVEQPTEINKPEATPSFAEEEPIPFTREDLTNEPMPERPEVQELLDKQAEANKAVEALSKRTAGTSLIKVLQGSLNDGEMSELGGRSRQVGKNPFISLVAKKGTPGSSMEDMVDSGALDLFLPVKMRPGYPSYDNGESAEYIREKLRQGQYYTDDTQMEIDRVTQGVWDLDKLIQEELSIDDINKEIQLAFDEQREADLAAEKVVPESKAGAAAAGERKEAESDFLKTQTAEELRAKQAEIDRLTKENERLAKEAERKAKADEQAREFTLTGSDQEADQAAARGQKDIFEGAPAEEAPAEEVAISSEQERKEALEQLERQLKVPIPPFRAKSANKTQLLKPAPLTAAQIKEILQLASDAVDAGLPPAVLGNVTAAGSTRLDARAVMSESGNLMIAKHWKASLPEEKLQALIHELGHAVDTNAGDIYKTPKWEQAHTELQNWYTGSANKFKHPLAYPFAPQFKGGVRPKQESFAQAFGYYFTSPVDLQKNAPEAYSQIQTIVERIQNGSQKARAAGTTERGTTGLKIQPSRTAKDSSIQPDTGAVGTNVSGTERLENRGAEELNAPAPVRFYEDIPNEHWLQGKINYAAQSPKNNFGVPKMSSVTGYFKNPVIVPTRWLTDAKGQRGEEKNVRKNDLEAIRKIIRETGKFPLTEDGKEYVPYIEIGYDGKPWVSEGNHRIMAAIAEGLEYIPVELRYFDGGQRRAGKWDPENVKEITERQNGIESADINASISPEEKEKSTWLFGRDKLGRVGFGPGAVAYRTVADITNKVLDKLAMKPISPELGRAMRNMKAKVELAKNKVAEVASEMNTLSPEERNMISDVIEGELKAGVHPPQHILNIAAAIQSMMSRQSKELVDLGMLSKEAANRWENKYLPRFYERQLKDSVNAWSKAAKEVFMKQPLMRGIRGSNLRSRGMYEVVNVDDLPNWLSEGWEQRDPQFDPKKSTETVVWRDYTSEERENMGEIRDAMFRFVMGYNASQRDIALGRLYKDLAKNYASRQPLEGYVQVPTGNAEGTGAARYGALEGMYVPKEIMDHLSANDHAMSEGILKLYRAGLSKWKEGKTVLNPVSHANNVISNVTMAHFAGVSYWDAHKYAGAIKDLAKNDEMVKEAKEVGLFGGTFSQADLIKSMPPELRAMANLTDSALSRFGERIWDVLSYTIEVGGKKYGARPIMQWAYENEDLFFRYVIYRDARNRGMNPEDARDYSQEFIFTYDDLPKGARLLRDYGMPFFSYSYKIVPVLARTALEYPWRYAAPATVAYATNAMMYAIAANLGGGDDDWWGKVLYKYVTDEEFRKKAKDLEANERRYLPEWLKGHSSILSTPKAIRMGMDEATGLPLFLDISRIFPGGDLLDANNNSGGMAMIQPLTPSNPVLTTLVAMMGNKDLFLGKDVTKKTDTDSEKAAKRAEWLWKQVTPAISVGNYHFDRAMNTVANMTGKPITVDAGPMGTVSYTGIGKDGLPVQPKHAMLQTMGIKIRPYDLEMGEVFDKNAKRSLVREIDFEISRIKRQEAKGVISPEAAEIERQKLKEKKSNIKQGLTLSGEEKE
jgi:hypothetical protein